MTETVGTDAKEDTADSSADGRLDAETNTEKPDGEMGERPELPDGEMGERPDDGTKEQTEKSPSDGTI